ncbi:MAG: hypothetical protein ACI8P0_001297 [Planctomycetaceae bacterium]|jgi:hypothetical protein
MSGSTLALEPGTSLTGSSLTGSANAETRTAAVAPGTLPETLPAGATHELQSQGVAEIVTREKDAAIGDRQAALDELGPLARTD